MEIWHIAINFGGRCYDEDRRSIEAARQWARDKLQELGGDAEDIEYREHGDDLIAEIDIDTRVTISPR